MPYQIEASLEAIAKYISLTTDLLSKFYNHSVLPCIIALIFSMPATSVNCERSFSDLNNRIGDKRHNLSNESLHSGILISGAARELKFTTSLIELKTPLNELLKSL